VRHTILAVALVLALLSSCVHSEEEKAKTPRTPRQVSEVTGIWRTLHQNTLELRQKGTYVLITSVSKALAGEFSLEQDHITFFNDDVCGGPSGTYRIQVASEQKLLLSEPDDPCTLRRTQLTADPFVYAS